MKAFSRNRRDCKALSTIPKSARRRPILFLLATLVSAIKEEKAIDCQARTVLLSATLQSNGLVLEPAPRAFLRATQRLSDRKTLDERDT
jgi:hypothetical protein